MQFFRSLTGLKAQLLYSIILVVFIVAASTYLFSITSIEQTFFSAEEKVISFVNNLKHIQFSQPKIAKKIPTPTQTIPSISPTSTDTISPVTVENPDTQLVNCIGPDGKTLWLTQNDCDNFNNAWKGIPTPTTTTTSSAGIN